MPEPIPFEAYYDLSLLTELAVSPDGDRVAFVASEFDGEADEARSSGSSAPARTTWSRSRPVRGGRSGRRRGGGRGR